MPDNCAHAPFTAAIACGGTGGHLFPGLAVGEELLRRGCAVTLMISPKDVDQKAIAGIKGMEIVTLPAVGLAKGKLAFFTGFWKSYLVAARHFTKRRPQAVLAMGGFVSAAPVVAGRRYRARTFLHDSNSVPGRASRWLAPLVNTAFVYFPSAGPRLRAPRVEVVGMPVRPQFFRPLTAEDARREMGLHPEHPVLLVMGGSQGARRLNELTWTIAPQIRQAIPELQIIHFTGEADLETAQSFYKELGSPAFVRAFHADMGGALAAADVALSRAGASSLAELAARQLPAVLIPYPTASDNHQYFNARAFVQSGAAWMAQQETATPELLAQQISSLLGDPLKRAVMQRALTPWRTPDAAAAIAARIYHLEGAVKNYDCVRASL